MGWREAALARTGDSLCIDVPKVEMGAVHGKESRASVDPRLSVGPFLDRQKQRGQG